MVKLIRVLPVFVLVTILAHTPTLKASPNVQDQKPEKATVDTDKESGAKKKKKKKSSTEGVQIILLPQILQNNSQPNTSAMVSNVSPVIISAATNSKGGATASKTPGISIFPAGQLGPLATATAGQLVISEFRVRGPNGATDEFIEIYNNSGADHTVTAASGSGYGIAASDGTTRCSIPNGTVIPNRGHYLCVNSVGYSLASYPAGNGTTATGDATYTTDIPDNAGIALFNNNTGGGSYSLANRLDAVGSTSEANTLYKEGTGYPALTPFSIDYAFYRDNCGKQGSITTMGACPTGGNLVDTDNNAANFVFVDTNGTSAGAGQRLGAPGPENLSSPIQRNTSFTSPVLDTCVAAASPPNRVRDFTSDPANNSTFGTLDIRRSIVNNTGGNVTRLRFRVVDVTTFPAPSGIADLRPRTSTAVVVTVDRPPCGSGTSNVSVQGTALEQPPSQPNGGGFNSSMSANTVTLATPLANGATLDVRFLLGIQQTGSFKFYINVEALP
ncbi:MAG TPA: lamin tail domain-containing protein [Pyrinomonadaceae bacterium]|nr:lamin tail domain-containing protein [Pyrinomonadaceae bacterium]